MHTALTLGLVNCIFDPCLYQSESGTYMDTYRESAGFTLALV